MEDITLRKPASLDMPLRVLAPYASISNDDPSRSQLPKILVYLSLGYPYSKEYKPLTSDYTPVLR